jgi:hypothetical protein
MELLDGASFLTAGELGFYQFVTRRAKVFDEREFGGAVFVTASAAREQSQPARR